jgi:flavin-binding protein dodecin
VRNPPQRPAPLPRSKTQNAFRQPSASLPTLRQTIQVYLRDRVRRLVWFETLETRKKIRDHKKKRPPRECEIPHHAQRHCLVAKLGMRFDSPPRHSPPSAKPYKFTSAIASEDLYGLKLWRLEKKPGPPKKTPSTRVRNPPLRPAPLPRSKTRNEFRQPSASLPTLRKTIQVYLRDRVKRLVWFETLETRKKTGTTKKNALHASAKSPITPSATPRSGTRNAFRQPSASLPALRQTIQVYLRDRVRRLVWFETLETQKNSVKGGKHS